MLRNFFRTAWRKLANEEWQFDIDNNWVGGWPYTYIQLARGQQPVQVEKQINQLAAKYSEKAWKENKMFTVSIRAIKAVLLNPVKTLRSE